MLVLPSIVALPFAFRSERAFPGALYATGITVEFFGSLILMLLHRRDGIDGFRYRRYEYFLRTIVGLPMSIYLSLYGLYGILGLLRLVAGIRFLDRIGLGKVGISYSLFFTAGYLFVVSMRGFPPSDGALIFAATSFFIGLLSIRN
jgi:hypothetical protein